MLALCTYLKHGKPKMESANATPFTFILKFHSSPTLPLRVYSKMLQSPRFNDDPFSSPLPETPPSIAVKWANRVVRPSRFSGLRLTPIRIGILLLLTGSFVLVHTWIPKLTSSAVGCEFATCRASTNQHSIHALWMSAT